MDEVLEEKDEDEDGEEDNEDDVDNKGTKMEVVGSSDGNSNRKGKEEVHCEEGEQMRVYDYLLSFYYIYCRSDKGWLCYVDMLDSYLSVTYNQSSSLPEPQSSSSSSSLLASYTKLESLFQHIITDIVHLHHDHGISSTLSKSSSTITCQSSVNHDYATLIPSVIQTILLKYVQSSRLCNPNNYQPFKNTILYIEDIIKSQLYFILNIDYADIYLYILTELELKRKSLLARMRSIKVQSFSSNRSTHTPGASSSVNVDQLSSFMHTIYQSAIKYCKDSIEVWNMYESFERSQGNVNVAKIIAWKKGRQLA